MMLRKLKKVLPKYYENDKLTGYIQSAAERIAIDEGIVEKELRLETSDVLLDIEERSIGGISISGATKEERADAVRARYRLINSGLSIADLQAALDQTTYGGTIKVRQPRGNPTVLDLHFNGKGIPSGSDELIERMTASLPCNVYINPVYDYVTHGELEVYTHGELETYTHNEIKEGDINDID